jgi:hypothetical protein
MNISHFFDLDVILTIDSKPWIIDKENPNIPLFKLSKSDFNLIKSGIYKNQGNKIEFNGSTFYLSTDIINKLKIKAKNSKVNMSNLAISMQEFLNTELIENIKYHINTNILSHLKNKTDDIYIICSKNSKVNYEKMMIKVIEELKKEGLNIKSFYSISETFYNRNDDKLNFNKIKILVQHLIGYKTEDSKFISEEIPLYGEVNFYDDDIESIRTATNINMIVEKLFNSSDDSLKEIILGKIKENKPRLIINKVSANKHNFLIKTEIDIIISKIAKTYESFLNRFKK